MRTVTRDELLAARHLDPNAERCRFTGQRPMSDGTVAMAIFTILPLGSGARDAERIRAHEALGKTRAGKPQDSDSAIPFWQRRELKVAHGFVLGACGPERVRKQVGGQSVETVHPDVAYRLRDRGCPVAESAVYHPTWHPEWEQCSLEEQRGILGGKWIGKRGTYGSPRRR